MGEVMLDMKIGELKRPKSNRSIEIRVLGALLTIGNPTDIRCQEIMSNIDLGCFYHHATKTIFTLIKTCFEKNHNFDYMIIESMIPTEIFSFYTMFYEEKYCTVNHIQQDIKDLLILKALRKQLPLLLEALIDCYDESLPITCYELLSNCLHNLSINDTKQSNQQVEPYSKIIDRILTCNEEEESSITIDLKDFPAIPKNQMITIAGRSGVGKSYYALFLMHKIAQQQPNKTCLYFNLEMKPETLVVRHSKLVTDTGLNDKEKVDNAASTLLEGNFNIITNQYITVEEIEIISRIESMKNPLSVIVIDYIGLVKTKQKYDVMAKHLEQSSIAQRLASLAGSLNCIVICLLQVNRDHKNRRIGDKCPYPTDSAESMGCERSSALWLGIDQPQIDSEEECYKDLFVVKNRKSREETGLFTHYLHFKDGKFYEIDQKMAHQKISNTITDISEFNRPKY